MDVTESKVPCAVRFFEDGGRLLAGPLDAVLHIFWHRYSDQLAFWHGAAEVRWDAASYLKACASVPVHRLVAEVVLADGRKGRAVAFGGYGAGTQAPGGPLLVVGLAGISALRVPQAT